MMKYIFTVIAALTIYTPELLACTYQDAQNKFMEFNNLMQVYSREINDYYSRSEEPPQKLLNQRDEMAEKSASLGVLLSKEFENDPNIQNESSVDATICNGFDELITKNTPSGYKAAPVKAAKIGKLPKCGSTDLWDRYYQASDRQNELLRAGRITKEEGAEYMNLSTLVGEYSTTDPEKACEVIKEIERKLDQE